MTWMSCALPFPGTETGLQDRFEAIFMALGGPADVALFSRTSQDYKDEVFLISPAAAAIEAIRALADWAPEAEPFAHKWGGLVFNANAIDRLGITLGH